MRSIFLSAALLVSTSLAMANPADDFTKKVNLKFPATVGARIAPSFPGFWSVVKNGEVLFVREDLSVLIPGDVIDLHTNQSLGAALREANKPHISTSDFDLKDAIRIGKGTRHLYVFSDPDCPYCKQLEGEFAKLKDVEVDIFPFPLVGLHPNARTVAETIWCQKDRSAAWRNYLLNGAAPQTATCDNPISRNLQLGERLQVKGTPVLIFDDGSVIPGAVSVERIEAQLAATARK